MERSALSVGVSLELVTPNRDDLPADFVLPFLRHTMLTRLGLLAHPTPGSTIAFFLNKGL